MLHEKKYFLNFFSISTIQTVLRSDGFQQLVCQPLYELAGINISREWEQLLAKMSQQFLLRNSQFYMSQTPTYQKGCSVGSCFEIIFEIWLQCSHSV